jgi:opacity protein-like surface antigen
MKKLSLFSIVFLMCIFTFAQNKSTISLSIGTTTPMGDFASKDSKKAGAGFANGGLLFDLKYSYKINNHFGFTAMLRRQNSPVDAQAYANEVAKSLTSGTVTISSTAWKIGGYMAGFNGTYPINDIFTLQGRALIGFLTAESPELKYTITDAGFTYWAKQNAASSSAFAYLFGAGLETKLSEKFVFLTNLDYLGASPEFVGVETIDSLGELYTDTYSQDFATITYSIGLGYKF